MALDCKVVTNREARKLRTHCQSAEGYAVRPLSAGWLVREGRAIRLWAGPSIIHKGMFYLYWRQDKNSRRKAHRILMQAGLSG
jgi:DNA-binding transcriptional LysR family regulator